MPETCWAVFKLQVINLRICCILLVDSVESMMMHGPETPIYLSLFLSSSTNFALPPYDNTKKLVCFFCWPEDVWSFLSFRPKLHLKEAVVKQMTPYSLVESYRPCWRKCCLHLLSSRCLQPCPPKHRYMYKYQYGGISAEGSILFSHCLQYPGRHIHQEISEAVYNGYIIFAVYCFFFLICGILEIKLEGRKVLKKCIELELY